MQLPTLPPQKKLHGTRIFLRVDWNIPLDPHLAPEASLKISRSIATINALRERGAIVIIATYLGRPKRREKKWSTRPLVALAARAHRLRIHFWDSLEPPTQAKPGDVYLLENVRFHPGEEKNDPRLAARYAAMADLFVNDAFGVCHRTHASIVGITRQLPSYAGPTLRDEIKALSCLFTRPKQPFIAIIGGAKISTKIDVLRALCTLADRVCVGGAMANIFFAAQNIPIGKSVVEREGIALAKKLLKNKKLMLPIDVVVAKKVVRGARARVVPITQVQKTDVIADIGPETMRAWVQEIKKARTILWNGPLGVAEIPTFSHGSLVIGRVIAAKSKGPAYGVVGGGDTLPLIAQTQMSEWVDHLSTGGGAMLECITQKGKLPGILALQRKIVHKKN